jgi:hypothetical protein
MVPGRPDTTAPGRRIQLDAARARVVPVGPPAYSVSRLYPAVPAGSPRRSARGTGSRRPCGGEHQATAPYGRVWTDGLTRLAKWTKTLRCQEDSPLAAAARTCRPADSLHGFDAAGGGSYENVDQAPVWFRRRRVRRARPGASEPAHARRAPRRACAGMVAARCPAGRYGLVVVGRRWLRPRAATALTRARPKAVHHAMANTSCASPPP